MRKSIVLLAALVMTGCQGLTGAPTATTGWMVQVGTPSLVHVPVIADQQTSAVNTTHIGTHKTTTTATPQAVPAIPVLPAPRLVPQRGDCCDSPAGDE